MPAFPADMIKRFLAIERKLEALNRFVSALGIQDGFQSGAVVITPSAANTPTSQAVTFPVPFSAPPTVMLTPNTTVPGTGVIGVAVTTVTATGFTAWLDASNTSARTINWLAYN